MPSPRNRAAARHLRIAPGPRILPGPRCGWPERCDAKTVDHTPEPGTRRIWTYHDVQCQRLNSRPVADPDPAGPVQCILDGYLDGYDVCALIDGHAGDCDYRRHAAEKALAMT